MFNYRLEVGVGVNQVQILTILLLCIITHSFVSDITIEDLNNMSWVQNGSYLDSNINFVIRNYDKLNDNTISRAIINNEYFREYFVKRLLKTDDIDLYCRIVIHNDFVSMKILELVDSKSPSIYNEYMRSEFVQFLLRHIESIVGIPKVMVWSMYKDKSFANLVADIILTNSDLNKKTMLFELFHREPNAFGYMLDGLASDKTKVEKMCKFLLELMNTDTIGDVLPLVIIGAGGLSISRYFYDAHKYICYYFKP